jgi:predicted alpha-1,6-mannanase (GH76 family)
MVDSGASAILEAWGGAGRTTSRGDQHFNLPVNGPGRTTSRGDQHFNLPVNGPGRTTSRGDQHFNLPVNGPGRGLEIRDVHPAWDLFSGSLFTEQLASSVSMTFGRAASER